jgi:hypothetical protein
MNVMNGRMHVMTMVKADSTVTFIHFTIIHFTYPLVIYPTCPGRLHLSSSDIDREHRI